MTRARDPGPRRARVARAVPNRSASRRGGRDELGLSGGLGAHLGIDAAGEAECERDFERNEHEHDYIGERREQAHAQAHQTSSTLAKRKPTPRTVWR